MPHDHGGAGTPLESAGTKDPPSSTTTLSLNEPSTGDNERALIPSGASLLSDSLPGLASFMSKVRAASASARADSVLAQLRRSALLRPVPQGTELRTGRKPRPLPLWSREKKMLRPRSAELQFMALHLQQPPRLTPKLPEAGPVGSVNVPG